MADYCALCADLIRSIDAEICPESQGMEFTQETCKALDRARDALASDTEASDTPLSRFIDAEADRAEVA